VASVARERLILAGILGVGALVRLYRLDLTWYFLDQARDVSTAMGIASGKSFPLLGPLIGWTHGRLGPLYFYLIAPPFLLSDAPLAGAVFVALTGVLAIFFTYRLASEYFGPGVALTASALFAVFPLAVVSSRVLWNPALVPLFTVLFMRALFALVVRGRSRAVVGVCAFLAILTQLHLTTMSLGLVALAALLVWRPRIRIVHVLAGVGVFLALYAPYLIHEASHSFENTRAILRGMVAGGGRGGELALLAVVKNLLMLDRPVLDGFLVAEPWPRRGIQAFSLLYGVEAVAFGVGLLVCLARLVRGFGECQADLARRSSSVLLLWLLAPVILLGSRRTALWWYYFDVLYPSQFITAGIGLAALAAPAVAPPVARRLLARATAAVVVAIVVVQTWFQIGLQRRVDAQGAIALQVPRLSVAAAGSSFGTLSFLPYAYRYRILRALVEDFGLDVNAFAERVHGPVLGLPDENELILRHLAARAPARVPDHAATAHHYLVIKNEEAVAASSGARRLRVGPYLIVEYQPAVAYPGWHYALVPRAGRDRPAEADWRRRPLPAANVGVLGNSQELLWRGSVHVPAGERAVRVAVLVSGEAPLEVFRVSSQGRKVGLIGRRSWQSPSLYSTTEILFDVSAAPGSEDEPVLFGLSGAGRVLRVDVYEPGVG
jgi:4-amino-4-deoxy-L-arabinose transferase-like glycosyltransferase